MIEWKEFSVKTVGELITLLKNYDPDMVVESACEGRSRNAPLMVYEAMRDGMVWLQIGDDS